MGMPIIEPSGITKCESITDIIQSVVMQEMGMAHILNAEGEKLDKIIDMPGITPEELIEANKSVEEMVRAATKLENMLLSRLELFSDCICDDCF